MELAADTWLLHICKLRRQNDLPMQTGWWMEGSMPKHAAIALTTALYWLRCHKRAEKG